MSRVTKAVEMVQRRQSRLADANAGLPLTVWGDAHARAVAALIPNPALLPAVVRTTDAQDAAGVFNTTVGWDD